MTQRYEYGKTFTFESDQFTFNGPETHANTAFFPAGVIVESVSSPNVTNIFNSYAAATYTSAKGNQGSWSGGFTASQDTAFERIGLTGRIYTGYTTASSGTNAVATFSVTLPVEMRPGTAGRGGPCQIYDSGTYKTGYFQVSTSGVLTVGASENSAGVLQPFTGGAGATGILDQVLSYSLF